MFVASRNAKIRISLTRRVGGVEEVKKEEAVVVAPKNERAER
jgi:hypothetical protein